MYNLKNDLRSGTPNINERNKKALEYSSNCRKKRFETVYNRFVYSLILLSTAFVGYCTLAIMMTK